MNGDKVGLFGIKIPQSVVIRLSWHLSLNIITTDHLYYGSEIMKCFNSATYICEF